MTEHEEQARKDAARVAFGYLSDKIGQTDVAELTPEQFDTFLAALFETYHERLIDLSGGNRAPF